jgi:hypothetical protein
MSILLARRGAIADSIPAVTTLAGILLGQWGFEDDNLNDSSGNGRHGTFTAGGSGGTLTYVDGPTAGTRGVQWGSGTNRISVGRTGLEATADGFCIMGWMKVPTVPVNSGYTAYGLSKARAAASTRSRFGVAGDGTTRSGMYVARWKDAIQVNESLTSSEVNDTGWHHHALVDGNTQWAYYIDGVLKASGTRSFDNSTSPTWEDCPWIIGYNSDIAAGEASGSISGMRIIQGQLTQAQVVAWMDTAIT